MLIKEARILRRIAYIQKRINIHPAYYLLPLTLSFLAAFFEGVSMGLLIPMMNGFLTKDYSFILNAPFIGDLFARMPTFMATRDQSLFVALLSIFVLAVLAKNLLRFAGGIGMSFVAIRSIHYLRRLIFQRFLQFGKGYFDSTSVGHDSTVLVHFAKYALRPLLVSDKYVSAAFSLVGYFCVMLFISWQLTLFALPLLALLHFAVRRLVARMHRLSSSMADSASLLGKQTIEILSSVPFVQAFNMQLDEQKKHGHISDESAKLSFKMASIQTSIPCIQEFLTLGAATILFTYMLYLMVRGNVGSPPSFIVYFYLVLNATVKFGTATNFRGVLAEAGGAVDDVMDILCDDHKYTVPNGTRSFTGLRESIEFKDVHFAYRPGTPDVLKGLSLTVPRGSMVALVGQTGVGKTTVLQLLLRHYDCPPSSVFIDGTDIREYDIASLRARIATVSQDTFLFNESLRHNITYGAVEHSETEVQRAIERARLPMLIDKLPEGLDTIIGDRGIRLSGGEKQRISIARALLRKADILLLDEATSALDSETERLIQEALDDAIKDKTAIVIAHRLSTIKHADHIVVIDQGRVAEEGTLAHLLEQDGAFKRLWEQQKFLQ